MRRVLIIGGAAVLSAVAGYSAMLLVLPLSFQNLSAGDPRLGLIVPKSLRQLQPPELCSAITYDKAPIDCAGTCGTAYGLRFGSRLAWAPLEAALDLPNLTQSLGAQEINLINENGGDCAQMRLNVYFDERPR